MGVASPPLMLLLWPLLLARSAAEGPAWEAKFTHMNITSWDGTRLPAILATPTPQSERVRQRDSETFPAIVMTNSWACDFDTEYYSVQGEWAKHGYVSLSYEARGWDGSGGQIGTAGPADVKDSAAVVDLLVRHAAQWRVNTSALATLGVSLGGGLAVLGAAQDSRIKCALTLSGWGNLTTALYGGDTPSQVWGQILVNSGKWDGHEGPGLGQRWKELTNRSCSRSAACVENVSRWSDVRSPLHYTEQLCGGGRRLPVFISNNMEDRLFKPDAALEYRDRLAAAGCRTTVLLNQGIHATAEIPALLNSSLVAGSPVWSAALSWLDQWLKGAPPNNTAPGTVHAQVRQTGLPRRLGQRGPYIPLHDSRREMRFALRGRARVPPSPFGQLLPLDDKPPGLSLPETILYSTEKAAGLTAGSPFVGEVLQVYIDTPILTDLAAVDTAHAAVFFTEPFRTTTRLCGTPYLQLRVSASAPVSRNASSFQVVAYLYSAPGSGLGKNIGTLLSHGPLSVWGNGAGGDWTTLDVRMRSLCWEVAASHRLAVGVDMASAMYMTANPAEDLRIKLAFDGASVLRLPLPVAGVVAT